MFSLLQLNMSYKNDMRGNYDDDSLCENNVKNWMLFRFENGAWELRPENECEWNIKIMDFIYSRFIVTYGSCKCEVNLCPGSVTTPCFEDVHLTNIISWTFDHKTLQNWHIKFQVYDSFWRNHLYYYCNKQSRSRALMTGVYAMG